MDNKMKLKKIVYTGLMIAVVFVLTRFTAISFTVGYFNLGDIGIILTSSILGGFSGMIAGGVGSALADISYGAMIFAPVTLVVKGIEGYLLGILLNRYKDKIKPLPAISVSLAFMVFGYFIATVFLFNLEAALADSLSTLIQAVVSVVVGYAIISMNFVRRLSL